MFSEEMAYITVEETWFPKFIKFLGIYCKSKTLTEQISSMKKSLGRLAISQKRRDITSKHF